MKSKQGARAASSVSKKNPAGDRIQVAVRIRPPLFKEFHEEKAFFEFKDVLVFYNSDIEPIN